MIRQSQRNSSIELLRIFAMFLIVLNHGLQDFPLSAGSNVHFINNILMNFGGVGDDVFFIISVWFLSSETPSFKKSLRRVWQLEQIVLFWSISLFVCFVASILFFKIDISNSSIVKVGIKSIFPNLTNLYWYTASYMLFILLHPWLQGALLNLSRISHRRLTILLVILFYVVPRGDLWNISDYSVIAFIILYIVFSYVKKYHLDIVKNRSIAISCLFVGLLLGVASLYVTSLLSSNGEPNRWIMNLPTKMPALLIAYGLISVSFSSKERHNVIVNELSSTMIASYLVLTYPYITTMIGLLIDRLNITGVTSLFVNIIICIMFIIVVSLCDLIRKNVFFKYIFASLFDKVFEKFYSFISVFDYKVSLLF